MEAGPRAVIQRKPVQVSCICSTRDVGFRRALERYLGPLVRAGALVLSTEPAAGDDWLAVSSRALETADIVVLLVSIDLLNSDDCAGILIPHALRRQAQSCCAVVPILVRSIDLSAFPFSDLVVLPRSGTPIALWRSEDEAWTDVARSVRGLAERIAERDGGFRRIRMRAGTGPGERSIVFRSECLLGRSSGCDFAFRLASRAVGRRHARWFSAPTGVGFMLEDLKSKYGTFVQGERIQRAAALHDGDSVDLGDLHFTYRALTNGAGALVERDVPGNTCGWYVLAPRDEATVESFAPSATIPIVLRRTSSYVALEWSTEDGQAQRRVVPVACPVQVGADLVTVDLP